MWYQSQTKPPTTSPSQSVDNEIIAAMMANIDASMFEGTTSIIMMVIGKTLSEMEVALPSIISSTFILKSERPQARLYLITLKYWSKVFKRLQIKLARISTLTSTFFKRVEYRQIPTMIPND
jgi:hypothetical protein